MASEETIAVRRVTLWLCDPCLDGAGGECHTPGCSLWINRAPDIPLRNTYGVTIHDGEPALTVAAVTPALAERMGEIADAAQDVVTKAEVDRCGWSEDPYHRCRVCYDYAAGRDRDHPLIADAAQEAGDE